MTATTLCTHGNRSDCCDSCEHAFATCTGCHAHASECTCTVPPVDGMDHLRTFGAAAIIVSDYRETEWRVIGTCERSLPFSTRSALVEALRTEVLSTRATVAA